MYNSISQLSFFFNKEIENLGDLERLNLAIQNIDDSKLIKELNKIRGNGRNDFPVGAMLNSLYAMMIYGHKSVSSMIRELSRNSQLRQLCGFVPYWRKDKTGVSKLITYPNNRAYTNFMKNLSECEIEYEEMFNQLVEYMSENIEDFGDKLAGDGKIIESYAKYENKNKVIDGRRDVDADYTVKKYTISNKNGEIVTKKKIYFGYRVHAIIDTKTELPVAINVTKASNSEMYEMLDLLKQLIKSQPKLKEKIKYFLADKGYDWTDLIKYLEKEGISPIIDICNNWQIQEDTKAYKNSDIEYTYDGKVYYLDDENKKHKMIYLGYDKKTDSLRYGFNPQYKKSTEIIRIKLNTDRRVFVPVARDSLKWKRLYKGRTSVERYNGRLDRDLGFEIHTIRGLKKMKMFVYMANIIMLGIAKGKIEQNHMEHLAALTKIA